jgi:hypothetical protein
VDSDVQDGGKICSFVSLRQSKQKPNKSHISSIKTNRAERLCVVHFLTRFRKRFNRTIEILQDNIYTFSAVHSGIFQITLKFISLPYKCMSNETYLCTYDFTRSFFCIEYFTLSLQEVRKINA